MIMKHDELASDLASHLRASGDVIAWENMQMGPAGSPRPDVYIMQKSYSKFRPMAYEVKVSVSDFRSDVTSGKWQSYLQYAAGVVFAVPLGLITKDDLPKGCGLIVRGEGWRHVKKPILQPISTLPHDAWMKLMIDGINRVDPAARLELRREFASAETLRKRYGEDIAKLLSNREHAKYRIEEAIKLLEIERQRIEDQRQKLRIEAVKRDADVSEKFIEMLKAFGLPEDASIWDLQIAMRKVRERYTENTEIARLNRIVENLRRQLEDACEPLPELAA
jgi:hypothetical protein